MLYAHETAGHRTLHLWSEMREVHNGNLSQRKDNSWCSQVIQQFCCNPDLTNSHRYRDSSEENRRKSSEISPDYVLHVQLGVLTM